MSLQIIGAGFGRTGTKSLKAALEELGITPCYHLVEVAKRDEAPDLWLEAARGRPDWDRIFDGYAATVDFPACTFWRELVDHYPGARVILSVRDPEEWYASTQATIFSPALVARQRAGDARPFFEEIVFSRFGGRVHDRETCIGAYQRHNAAVIRAIPGERLLVHDVADGWAPLCQFLGLPVPSTPFPRANTAEEFRRHVVPCHDDA